MKKIFSKVLITFLFASFCLQSVFAFEDFIIVSNEKLSDIKVENPNIINVYPLVTVMNNKDTIIVHPLKEGKTKFSVLKNKTAKIEFNVNIENGFTKIEQVRGFDILSLDKPPIIKNDNQKPTLRKDKENDTKYEEEMFFKEFPLSDDIPLPPTMLYQNFPIDYPPLQIREGK